MNPVSGNVPNSFELHQNFPNPFNPRTVIRFYITRDTRREMQDIKLVIYSALGKEVAVIVNQKLVPGNYEVEFDARLHGQGSELTSGIYFYELSTKSFSVVKSMILLK